MEWARHGTQEQTTTDRNLLSGHQQWEENSPESFIVTDSSSRLPSVCYCCSRRDSPHSAGDTFIEWSWKRGHQSIPTIQSCWWFIQQHQQSQFGFLRHCVGDAQRAASSPHWPLCLSLQRENNSTQSDKDSAVFHRADVTILNIISGHPELLLLSWICQHRYAPPVDGLQKKTNPTVKNRINK